MKKSSSFLIITVLFLPLISAVGWELSIPTTARPVGSNSNLRVREGSPFRIAIFADLHFGEDTWTDWGPHQDVNSVNVMSAVLDAETPGQFKHHCIESEQHSKMWFSFEYFEWLGLV